MRAAAAALAAVMAAAPLAAAAAARGVDGFGGPGELEAPRPLVGRPRGGPGGDVDEALLRTLLDIIAHGLSTADSLNKAFQNATWAAEHRGKLATAAFQLRRAWEVVEEEAVAWARERPSVDRPADSFEHVAGVMQPLLVTGLVCAAAATLRGLQPFDLFSPEVHSRSEVALAFTIASLVSMSLANSWRLQLLADNPFALYVAQLLMCFFSTSATVPMVCGAYRDAPRWVIFASVGAAIWFSILWLTSSLSILPPVAFHEDSETSAQAVVVTLLSFALFAVSSRKIGFTLGWRRAWLEPFYNRSQRDCKEYLRKRLLGGPRRVCGSDLRPPLYAPAALLVAVFSVGSFVCITAMSVGRWAVHNSADLHRWVLDYLIPLQPLFEWAGSPLPMESIEEAIGRSLVCFVLGLATAIVYIAWLLRTVILGYRRIFVSLMRAEGYQGRSLVETSAPVAFHPQWGTYIAGALVGNCMMAFATIGSLTFVLALILSLPQFWSVLWTARQWYIFYSLLYMTRWVIFRMVVPKYVVTCDGSILRRRLWSLLFPTLMLLNFVVGATSGVIRFFVMFPFMLVRYFRVDMTFLPEGWEDWDWSFHPFLCLVIHAHTRLNPVMCAIVAELGSGPPRFFSGAAAAAEPPPPPSPPRPESAACSVGGEQSRGQVSVASSASSSALEAGRLLAVGRQCARELRRRPTTAGSRWRLAVTLARNPSLAAFRRPGGGAGAAASGAAAASDDAVAADEAAG